jgi:hypothetical protein
MVAPALFPRWRQVAADLLADGLPDGKVVPKALLADLLGLRDPTTAEEQRKHQLRLMSATAEIKRELLERHMIHLRADGRGNLVVTPPEAQTDVVMRDGQAAMARAMGAMEAGVSFVRLSAVSDEARRRNADAQAKLAMLAAMHRQHQIA